MRPIALALSSAAALLVSVAGPAAAQEPAARPPTETVTIEVPLKDRQPHDYPGVKYVGKSIDFVWLRDVERPASRTVRTELRPEEACPGDIPALKSVGKRMERVYYRDDEVRAEPFLTTCGAECSYGYFTTGKHIERRSFCEMKGGRVFCGHGAGECAKCAAAE